MGDAFDVAIVGAGPAGSRAAWRLARGGARVALIDDSHPREKPCGGGVTARARAIVSDALPTSELEGVAITSATFEHAGRTAHVTLPRDDAALLVVRRETFDGALRSAAGSAGAILVERRAAGVERTDGAWEIRIGGDRIRASWIIGADGAASLVRRQVAARFDRRDLSIATGYFVHGASDTDIAIGFVDRPAGYLWSFPRTDHLAVGVCAQADEASQRALEPFARDWIVKNLDVKEDVLEKYSWPIPSLSAAALDRLEVSGPGWMLAGDAAGLVDPITREGIFFALQSGDAAADALLGRPGEAAAVYAAFVRRHITPELSRAAALKGRFFAPRFMHLLVSALQRSAAIRTIMADLVAGAQPYRGLRRRLLATFELRLLVELFGLFPTSPGSRPGPAPARPAGQRSR